MNLKKIDRVNPIASIETRTSSPFAKKTGKANFGSVGSLFRAKTSGKVSINQPKLLIEELK